MEHVSDKLYKPGTQRVSATSQEHRVMPHVIVKLYSGRSEQQKATLAEQVTKAVMSGAQCAEAAVSVSIEDVEPDDWTEKVYNPDIIGKPGTLYKKPGYDPL